MMIYCPECGSEVAPVDSFCQYCGIALTPVNFETPAPAVEEKSEPVNIPAPWSEPKPEISEDLNESIPSTPLVLTEDYQPPVAHLDELLPQNAFSETGQNLPPVESPVSEIIQTENLVNELPKEETPFEPEQPPTLTDETPINFQNEPISEPIESPVPDPIPPIDIEIPNKLISEDKEESELISDFPVYEKPLPPQNEESLEFEATIPYNPSDFVKNDLQFSNSEISALDRISEYKDVIEGNSTQNEDDIDKTTPPHSDLGVFPKVETVQEISTQTIPEPFSEQANAVETFTPFVKEENPIFPIEPKPEAVEIKPLTLEENSSQDLIELPPPELPQIISKPLEPIQESVQTPVSDRSEEINSGEGRAFTNPIVGDASDTDGKSKTKLKPLELGTVLNNRYEIVRKIGGGGMGAVYLASDRNLGGVNRAVKEMVQSYIEESQQDKAIADFKRESLLLTSLDHIAIPTIFDYFYDEKEARFYLVMKYISGGDLAGRLRAAPEGRIDEITVTDWAIQIADVLDYLHNHEPPIVYRDLKPSNIMLDGNSGKVMLIDFGIARWVNKEEKGVTAVGTMGYAPPELFSGNVEPRSDIYSLGSTMFHLLTGADPQSNPLLIFDFNKNPRPRQINSQLTDQIEQILMRAVEYNSNQRFSSAAEMRDALQSHLDNLKKGTVSFGVLTPTSGMPMTGNLPVFCGFCGQKILATDMFCPFCGAQQPLAGQSQKLPNQQVYSAPKVTARLMIVGTNELENTEFNLEKDSNLVGRRDPMSNIFPEVDLSKYDPQTKISRKHARIWRESDVFMLEDLGSSNGTILISATNNPSRLLPRQPHVLANGDKIRVGDTTLRFTVG
ncbi:MAG: protein kinase [Pyrinomonadaceae bacterium]|nr:protein kinase [Pyrinomonadaceae bacterium]